MSTTLKGNFRNSCIHCLVLWFQWQFIRPQICNCADRRTSVIKYIKAEIIIKPMKRLQRNIEHISQQEILNNTYERAWCILEVETKERKVKHSCFWRATFRENWYIAMSRSPIYLGGVLKLLNHCFRNLETPSRTINIFVVYFNLNFNK